MKYIVIIGDGMADRPIVELGGLTPLQKAHTPNMDSLARHGIIGRVRTVPEGFPPGSDVANLSIMGYNPASFYTGRAPLEAASIGVALDDTDVAYRCNLVTLRFNDDRSDAVMEDYSSGHITTAEAREIIQTLKEELDSNEFTFHPGVSYRHLLVWKNGKTDIRCTPPHDITDRQIAAYLPEGDGGKILRDLMTRSVPVLERHPVNLRRRENGKRTATSIWLWGQGRKPMVPNYREKYGIRGALISAVDLTKGLGIYAGLDILQVPGVTGWIDTNYAGKASYALDALKDTDFVYIHVEAPDEAGHTGSWRDKIQAIEDFDRLVVGAVMQGLKERFDAYRILLMPDHATPVEVKTHTPEPVPFVIFDSRVKRDNDGVSYDESITERPGVMAVERGYTLMDYFIREEMN
ncbi:MAG TPA: cofactor-independent phosphoglycerate mutase [Dissulfurispiraceae bacterium]|nr:cofactor-independent phosphoglycerate mutase [Dissulfurispiraceae bacterium]